MVGYDFLPWLITWSCSQTIRVPKHDNGIDLVESVSGNDDYHVVWTYTFRMVLVVHGDHEKMPILSQSAWSIAKNRASQFTSICIHVTLEQRRSLRRWRLHSPTTLQAVVIILLTSWVLRRIL